MINGWRFWIPAATINFKLVPLQYQVRGRVPQSATNFVQAAGFTQPSKPCVCAPTLACPFQVLYMSTCGMLWTGYLSYQSAAQAK